MSTRSNKGIGLLLVGPLDLELVIHKSKRAVDTLQAAIGSIEIQVLVDIVHPTSIDTVHPTSIDTVHPTSIDTVHPTFDQHCSSAIDRHYSPTSIDTVHQLSIDIVHPPSTDTGAVIFDVIDVAETNDFDLNREWYDWGSVDPFRRLPHEDPRDLIKELEELGPASEQNEVSIYHIICKIFPYSLSGDAFSWFSQLQPRSLTCCDDIKTTFLNKFLYEATETRQKEFDDMFDKMIKGQEKELMSSFSQMLGIVYTELKEESETMKAQIEKPEIEVQWTYAFTRREEADISDTTSTSTNDTTSTFTDSRTSTSTDGTTSTSIDGKTSTSTNGTTSTSTDGTTSTSIDSTTSTSTNGTASMLIDDIEKEITMEDFLDLEEFLELDLEEFLELEEWLEDMDQNSKKKLDDDQNTSRGDLETSPKAIIGRHQPDEINRHPPCIIDQHPPSIIVHHLPDSIDLHPPDSIDLHPPESIDRHPLLDEPHGFIVEMEPIEERVHESKASHNGDSKHLRPLICTKEADGLHKRMKRIHNPVKIVVPCAVFEAESPIPLDRSMQFSSYIEGWRCHHAIRQVGGKEEEELEEEKKDQGRSSGIIDPSLLRWCQEIQSAQQMLLTTICKASSAPYC
ncbi:hypothetical protein DY000_02022062 [Brassica cretica]|uniref:Retrotransposon gag domain-containing protein n=1 Tax=Brassica cretica TaxID=69181 RepID=A0ABQ7EDT5_BRACR|nr:hypothetical protein DY000_02022062 [Brassica cretica]